MSYALNESLLIFRGRHVTDLKLLSVPADTPSALKLKVSRFSSYFCGFGNPSDQI